MLYLEKPTGVFTPVDYTKPIGDVRYPPNIETLWSAADLAAINLYEPVDPGVPDGKVSDGFVVSRINGTVTIVYKLIDAPVLDISPASVWEEKERRLALGFDYDFGDDRGVHHISTTPTDMLGWNEVGMWATAKSALGQEAATTTILTDTGPVVISPTEWYEILDRASTVRQAIWKASFVLAAADPIPKDYATNENYWKG